MMIKTMTMQSTTNDPNSSIPTVDPQQGSHDKSHDDDPNEKNHDPHSSSSKLRLLVLAALILAVLVLLVLQTSILPSSLLGTAIVFSSSPIAVSKNDYTLMNSTTPQHDDDYYEEQEGEDYTDESDDTFDIAVLAQPHRRIQNNQMIRMPQVRYKIV
jgi:hypothetical protein